MCTTSFQYFLFLLIRICRFQRSNDPFNQGLEKLLVKEGKGVLVLVAISFGHESQLVRQFLKAAKEENGIWLWKETIWKFLWRVFIATSKDRDKALMLLSNGASSQWRVFLAVLDPKVRNLFAPPVELRVHGGVPGHFVWFDEWQDNFSFFKTWPIT